jgi:hypothetical protein
MKTRMKWYVMGLSIVLVVGLVLVGCSWLKHDDTEIPTAPEVADTPVVNVSEQDRYDQSDREPSVEQTVNTETYEIHVVRDESFPCYPYNDWVYLEMNKQQGSESPSGVNQVNVDISDVVLHFSGLLPSVSAIRLGIPVSREDLTTYTEVGTYPVSGGAVSIPVAFEDLAAFFGPTHYAVWYMLIGGTNGVGCDDVTLTVTGMHLGQSLSVTKDLKFGSRAMTIIFPSATTIPTDLPR